jgi:hypothetical protein
MPSQALIGKSPGRGDARPRLVGREDRIKYLENLAALCDGNITTASPEPITLGLDLPRRHGLGEVEEQIGEGEPDSPQENRGHSRTSSKVLCRTPAEPREASALLCCR